MKNKRALVLLFLGNSISGVAQGISMIAIPSYLAIELGLSQFLMQVYFVVAFVSLFWAFLAGVLIDRMDRKNILLLEAGVGALFLAGVAFIGFKQGYLQKEWVAAVYAFTFLLYTLHYPNLYAFIQEIIEAKNFTKISSWMEIIGQFSTLSAGALAALFLSGNKEEGNNLFGFNIDLPFNVPHMTIEEIFLVDGISYLLAFFVYLGIRYESFRAVKQKSASLFGDFKEGLNFLRQRIDLWLFGLSSYLVFISVLLVSFSLIPVYLKNHLNAPSDIYASAEMYFAFGSLGAGVFASRLLSGIGKVRAVIILSFLGTLVVGLLTQIESYFLLYLLMFLFGLSNAGTRIFRVSYLFDKVPREVMGRVGTVISNSGMLLRVILAGLFALSFFSTGSNILVAFYILSGMCFLGVCWMIFNYRRLRDL